VTFFKKLAEVSFVFLRRSRKHQKIVNVALYIATGSSQPTNQSSAACFEEYWTNQSSNECIENYPKVCTSTVTYLGFPAPEDKVRWVAYPPRSWQHRCEK